MIASLVAVLALQAGPEHRLFCLADPASGEVEVALLQPAADGSWRRPGPAGAWTRAAMKGRPEAAGLDWYEAGEPIVRDGVRHLPAPQTWSPGGAVNRYLRHIGLHDGAPLFSIWPGGGRDLAVLVRQEGCVFRSYLREEAP